MTINTTSQQPEEVQGGEQNGVSNIPALKLTREAAEPMHASSIKVSLWIVPSGETYNLLQNQINTLSEVHKTPTFEPHVTLVSGVDLNPNKIPNIMLKLREAFTGFGSIPCIVDRSKGIVAAGYDAETKECKWNQSTVAILERDEQIIKAVHLARDLLLGVRVEHEDEDLLFKPPLNEPHLSLAYCNNPLGQHVKVIPEDFYSKEIKLVVTDPSTLQGVSSWMEVGKFSL